MDQQYFIFCIYFIIYKQRVEHAKDNNIISDHFHFVCSCKNSVGGKRASKMFFSQLSDYRCNGGLNSKWSLHFIQSTKIYEKREDTIWAARRELKVFQLNNLWTTELQEILLECAAHAGRERIIIMRIFFNSINVSITQNTKSMRPVHTSTAKIFFSENKGNNIS